jgi:hypothetical protein
MTCNKVAKYLSEGLTESGEAAPADVQKFNDKKQWLITLMRNAIVGEELQGFSKPHVGLKWERVPKTSIEYQEEENPNVKKITNPELENILLEHGRQQDGRAWAPPETFIMKDAAQFRKVFADSKCDARCYICIKESQKEYYFQESTNVGLKGHFSNRVGAESGSTMDNMFGSMIGGIDALYNSTDFLEEVYDEMVNRLSCSVTTKHVVSGKVGSFLKYTGIRYFLDKGSDIFGGLASILYEVGSADYIGDILYELGRRLRDPPLTQHMLDKLGPAGLMDQVLHIAPLNTGAAKRARSLSRKLDVKKCKRKGCENLPDGLAENSPDKSDGDEYKKKKTRGFKFMHPFK